MTEIECRHRIKVVFSNLLMLTFAVIFTISLFFVTLILSDLLHIILIPIFPSLGFLALSPLFIIIGLVCFIIILVIIITGFIIKRLSLAKISSFLLCLPMFGHFFLAMFFLGGVQVFQIILLPLDSTDFNILSLGSIINLPYIIANFFASFFSYKETIVLYFCYSVIIIGLFIFIMGVFSWLKGVVNKKRIVDFSIYRYSRHPQLFGYLIWSYGIYLLTRIIPPIIMRGARIFDFTFTWLLGALIIIGIALYEEIIMNQKFPEEYEEYQKKTPFLFPLPRFVTSFLTYPLRLVFKKERPENKKEVLFFLTFYAILIILVSFLFDILFMLILV